MVQGDTKSVAAAASRHQGQRVYFKGAFTHIYIKWPKPRSLFSLSTSRPPQAWKTLFSWRRKNDVGKTYYNYMDFSATMSSEWIKYIRDLLNHIQGLISLPVNLQYIQYLQNNHIPFPNKLKIYFINQSLAIKQKIYWAFCEHFSRLCGLSRHWKLKTWAHKTNRCVTMRVTKKTHRNPLNTRFTTMYKPTSGFQQLREKVLLKYHLNRRLSSSTVCRGGGGGCVHTWFKLHPFPVCDLLSDRRWKWEKDAGRWEWKVRKKVAGWPAGGIMKTCSDTGVGFSTCVCVCVLLYSCLCEDQCVCVYVPACLRVCVCVV